MYLKQCFAIAAFLSITSVFGQENCRINLSDTSTTSAVTLKVGSSSYSTTSKQLLAYSGISIGCTFFTDTTDWVMVLVHSYNFMLYRNNKPYIQGIIQGPVFSLELRKAISDALDGDSLVFTNFKLATTGKAAHEIKNRNLQVNDLNFKLRIAKRPIAEELFLKQINKISEFQCLVNKYGSSSRIDFNVSFTVYYEKNKTVLCFKYIFQRGQSSDYEFILRQNLKSCSITIVDVKTKRKYSLEAWQKLIHDSLRPANVSCE